MKRKLRIEELSVASFSTEADTLPEQRGTVRGMQIGTIVLTNYTCARTCPNTCYATCDNTCNVTCPITACDLCH